MRMRKAPSKQVNELKYWKNVHFSDSPPALAWVVDIPDPKLTSTLLK